MKRVFGSTVRLRTTDKKVRGSGEVESGVEQAVAWGFPGVIHMMHIFRDDTLLLYQYTVNLKDFGILISNKVYSNEKGEKRLKYLLIA